MTFLLNESTGVGSVEGFQKKNKPKPHKNTPGDVSDGNASCHSCRPFDHKALSPGVFAGSLAGEVDGSRGAFRPRIHTPERRVSKRSNEMIQLNKHYWVTVRLFLQSLLEDVEQSREASGTRCMLALLKLSRLIQS